MQIQQIIRLLNPKLYVPSRLPLGVTEFNSWADSIIEASGLPNNDSMKFALAGKIMHMDETSAFKPKIYFISILIKSAANQVAYAVGQELKNKQIEQAKQQELQQQAAAAAPPTAVATSENNNEQQSETTKETVVQ